MFAALVLLAPCAVSQVAVNDLFDRPNSTNLGMDWIEQDGDAAIQSNRLQGNSPFFFGWSMNTVYAAPFATTVVRARWSMNGGGGDRISLIAGADPSFGGIEVRIGDNTGNGLADRVWFNAAINAGTWFTGSVFFNLTTPLVSGTATLWFTNGGDVAHVEILNPTTQTTETFSAGGILSSPFAPTGTAVAVGYFGNAWCDDFQAWTGAPLGLAYTATPMRVNHPTAFLVTRATPQSSVVMAYSLVGAGPIPTPLGNVGLDLPIFFLPPLLTDAFGRAALVGPAVPANLMGLTVHTQVIDLGVPALSNFFSLTVF